MTFTKTLSLTSLVFLFIMNTANASNAIEIENAWSPEAPPVVKVLAGYMKINNLSDKDIKINSVKSSMFERVEIHLTEMKNGMMKMVKQENLNIKAKGSVELKPGGLHMMLIGKSKPVKAGSIIPLTLTFDNGETQKINLKVKDDKKPTMKCGGGGKCGSM